MQSKGEWLHLSRGLDWLPAVVSCSHKAKAAIESPPQCVTDPGKPRFQPLVNAFHRDLLIKEQENFVCILTLYNCFKDNLILSL